MASPGAVDGSDDYTWDFHNQLTGADTDGTAGNDVTFEYDALGRRVRKDDGTDDVVYVRAGQQVIAEYAFAAAAGSPTEQYVYGSYIDEPIIKDGTLSSGTGLVYYHHDRGYSVIALTDSSGTAVERYAYSPYGELSVFNGSGSSISGTAYANAITSTGRWWDDETELYYFRARYYDCRVGIFVQRDPLEYVDGLSLYRAYFVPNHLDPWGKLVRVDDHDSKKGVAKGPTNPQVGGGGLPVTPTAGCCYVFVWLPQAFTEVGHASLHCGTFYVSFWPATGGGKKGSDPSTWHTYPQDETIEGRAPDEIIELCCLDKTKMAAVLAAIKTRNPNFECIGQNCSTISGEVLWGGVDQTKPDCKSYERLKGCFNRDGSVEGIDKPSSIRRLANCLKHSNCKAWWCEPNPSCDPNNYMPHPVPYTPTHKEPRLPVGY